ncbi:MAG TPA: hypothetical protein VGH20_16585 [Myxococcales bacterium]|jgi:hypothetical protein
MKEEQPKPPPGMPPEPLKDPGMKRLFFEVALVVGVLVLGLEAVHYRNAVLECNVDRHRAWNTVVDLREKNEVLEKQAYTNPPAK